MQNRNYQKELEKLIEKQQRDGEKPSLLLVVDCRTGQAVSLILTTTVGLLRCVFHGAERLNRLRTLPVGEDVVPVLFNLQMAAGSQLAIDTDGNIYISGWSKGETWYKNVFHLQSDGKLYGFSYGHYDMTEFDEHEIYNFYEVYGLGHSYSDSPFSYVELSTLWSCRISDEELEKLVSTVEDIMKFQDPDGCGKPNHVTSTAGLEFYQVITEDRRK